VSWYDSDFSYRASVSIDNTAGSGGANDWTLSIPAGWDHFWDNTLANGYDTVLVSEDGSTKLDFERNVWIHASNSGNLRVDAHQLDTTNMHHAWLYYGNASAAADPATSVTISGALTAKAELGFAARARPMVLCRPERPGRTAPTPQISKPSTGTIHLWWDLGRILQKRATASNGKLLYEEIEYAQIEVYDGASDQSSLYDATATRIVDGRYVRTLIKAGTDGTDYTPRLTIGTTLDRVLDFRALLQVRDVDED